MGSSFLLDFGGRGSSRPLEDNNNGVTGEPSAPRGKLFRADVWFPDILFPTQQNLKVGTGLVVRW